jgi:diaminohydroxyphosphoribosylaminopyrimidine deaminase/5-amino-6-(5-phosphoribosylamino)uracil reductase
MKLALDEAWKYQGLTYPNPSVGALILDSNNQIISIQAHHKQGSAHAELNAIVDALIKMGDKNLQNIKSANKQYNYILQNHNKRFKNFTIYVTLEPCNHHGSTPPCSLLLASLKFKKVVVGSIDPNKNATGGISKIKEHKIEVKTGILKKKCDNLIKPFNKWQNNQPFVYFKLAKHLNGVYDAGITSSTKSRKLVHKLREKIDLLIIGGNTIRVDRPILDCRMVSDKAPDILIYSKNKNFDKTIPLFQVKNRKIYISDNFNIIKNYRNIMIEGGIGMLKASQNIVDWYLFFSSDKMRFGETLQIDVDLKRLHYLQNKHDNIEWFEREIYV